MQMQRPMQLQTQIQTQMQMQMQNPICKFNLVDVHGIAIRLEPILLAGFCQRLIEWKTKASLIKGRDKRCRATCDGKDGA